MSTDSRVVALLGQPNSGKSTLFNGLTGARQRVGNWPGKTVEKKEGSFIRNGVRYTVADLPGSYSLSAGSDEEIVTRDYIASGGADLVCILADASQLERSLYMLADFAGITTPAILLLNMMDIAEEKGKEIDAAELEKRLGIPVVPFIAADRKAYDGFYRAVEDVMKNPSELITSDISALYDEVFGGPAGQLRNMIPKDGIGHYSAVWLTAKVLEGDEPTIGKVKSVLPTERQIEFEAVVSNIKNGSLLTGDCKFRWIERVLDGAVTNTKGNKAAFSRFDRLATSKRWGKWIALGVVLLGLVGSMIPAAPLMGLGVMIPSTLGPPLTAALTSAGASPFIVSLICDGFLNALYLSISMTGFVFGITLVFGLIEEIGYMARISFVFDGFMSKLGLQGKAIMPFLVSLGCTIGGAAGTRTIDSWGQRILAIALLWAVPCGAIFAVVPTLASIFFGWGAALVMVAIFAVMVLHMLITAKIFGKRLVPQSERMGMIMELPPYHKPKWGNLLRYVFLRVKDIFLRAFKVIFVMSMVFFILSYSFDGNVQNSVIYGIGTFIEPVTRFFGMGWQTFIAFISSAISKEAVLGVLSALYAGTGSIFDSTMGTAAASATLGESLAGAISKPEALAFIFATTFNIPCVMALASTYQESHSIKWTVKIAGYYMGMALILAFIVYHVSRLFF